jgi:hypothetical protein
MDLFGWIKKTLFGDTEKVRTRGKKGRFLPDDPTTARNEAWTTRRVPKNKKYSKYRKSAKKVKK